MKILITGGCGFVGTNISIFLKKKGFNISSLDNLIRKGSRYNHSLLKKNKIKNYKIDISNYKKIQNLPKFDLIIDCCAEAAVEVSKNEIDRVFSTNLIGTLNILKYANKHKSKLIFLSSSRVYSISKLNDLVQSKNLKKKLNIKSLINENFSIRGPKSIYGFTKLASEMLIEEFSYAFNLKYIINRCGVISGPLQFGKQDQGFVSLWIWKHLVKGNLKYIGYHGYGNQIRDVLHIDDLCSLIFTQIKKINSINNKLFTVGGSTKNSTSLLNLTKMCEEIAQNRLIYSKISKTSIYDIPFFITDNKLVSKTYNWKPHKNLKKIVKDIYVWLKKDFNILKKYF